MNNNKNKFASLKIFKPQIVMKKMKIFISAQTMTTTKLKISKTKFKFQTI